MTLVGNKVFQVKKIADGIYLRYAPDNSGQYPGMYTVADHLMISYNSAVKSSSDVRRMVSTIQETLIPSVEEHFIYFR